MRILGYSIALGMFLMAILLGGSFGLFVNVPSILIVGGGTFGMIIAKFGYNGIKTLYGPPSLTRKSVANFGSHVSVLTGWLGFLISVVLMAANGASDRFFDWIGPATAVALLTILYGHCLQLFLFLPLQYIDAETGIAETAKNNTDTYAA